MAETTKIEWTDHTFNPWRGCAKVAAGCANCYAARDAVRFPAMRGIWGTDGTRVKASAAMWREPLKWNKAAERDGVRRRVFCASLADVFEDFAGQVVDHHGEPFSACNSCGQVDLIDAAFGFWEQGTDEVRGDVFHCTGCSTGEYVTLRPATLDDLRRELFKLIDQTPWLDWLLLTKRPENIYRMWPQVAVCHVCGGPACDDETGIWRWCVACEKELQTYGTRKNVWLGTSIAEQKDAGKNIPELLKCRGLSPVLFLSCEPLVEPVDLWGWITPVIGSESFDRPHWVIVGGESGPGARPFHVGWAQSIVNECRRSGVPVFVKQLGANTLGDYYGLEQWRERWEEFPHRILQNGGGVELVEWDHRTFGQPSPGSQILVRLPDKGGDPSVWPESLRVREFPAVEAAHV